MARGKKLDVNTVTLRWNAEADLKVTTEKRSLHLNLMLVLVNEAGSEGITGKALCDAVRATLPTVGDEKQVAHFAKYADSRHVAWVLKKFDKYVSGEYASAPVAEAAPVSEEAAISADDGSDAVEEVMESILEGMPALTTGE